METTIRGILEKDIDLWTDPKKLSIYAKVFKEMFPMKSLEDCLFGLVIGVIFGRFVTLNELVKKDVKAESMEFWSMIHKRTMEIRGAIKLALGK